MKTFPTNHSSAPIELLILFNLIIVKDDGIARLDANDTRWRVGKVVVIVVIDTSRHSIVGTNYTESVATRLLAFERVCRILQRGWEIFNASPHKGKPGSGDPIQVGKDSQNAVLTIMMQVEPSVWLILHNLKIFGDDGFPR
mmetsp:Transcript_99807/g.279519  ORF Transcript_99807/g.279519 Transcript_99807/m.279519 type:complete len:141 (+) Transcript_99807:380-802(+)